jgi:hypothetical protein
MIHSIMNFFTKFFARPELEGLDPEQVKEIARDMNVTADDLYLLDRSGSEPALMPQRLSQEGVDPAVIQAEWPSVWKDLQRVCSLCGSKDVCRNELELAPEANDWRHYCPNEGTIRSLKS